MCEKRAWMCVSEQAKDILQWCKDESAYFIFFTVHIHLVPIYLLPTHVHTCGAVVLTYCKTDYQQQKIPIYIKTNQITAKEAYVYQKRLIFIKTDDQQQKRPIYIKTGCNR